MPPVEAIGVLGAELDSFREAINRGPRERKGGEIQATHVSLPRSVWKQREK